MVTINDVAKKAKVAVSTASRALHNNGYVSKAKKERILSVANELGYIVNVNAMQLKQKNQKTVGIIVSDITNPFFASFVQDLKIRLKDISYDLNLTISNGSPIEEEKELKYLIGNKVSKILLIPSTSNNSKTINLAKQNGIDVIQLFISVYKDVSSICNDDALGVYLASKQLIKEGYSKIALLDVAFDENEFVDVYPRRKDGIIKAQKENPNIQFKTFNIFPEKEFSKEDKREIESFNPDAIIAGTGIFGLNVLEYLKITSRQIKLVSFDDNDWLEYLGVTTIRQSRNKLLDETINFILKEQNLEVSHITIEESLVIRN